jgi:isopenicillin-N N-acyltransferase-like protein
MTVPVHISTEDDGRARGRALGDTWRADIQATWAGYERFFAVHDLDRDVVRTVGEHTLETVAAWAPQLADEIAGIAEGAALEPWQAAALNARSEVLARYRPSTPGECSTAVHLPAGAPPRTIQTWDWHDRMGAVTLVRGYVPRPGRTVKTVTEFGMLAKIGVTSDGVGLHFNLLQHDTDGTGGGVPVHLIARRILDEAGDLDEAEEIARSARVSASVALTVVTYDGTQAQGCTLEVSPAGVARLRVRPDGFLLHTNHFLDPVLATGERLGPVNPDTYARHEELERRTSALCAGDIADRAAALVQHQEDGSALCCHPTGDDPITSRWQTLLTVGLDVDQGALVLQGGNPCTHSRQGWVRI